MKVSRKSFKIGLFVAGVLFGCGGCGGGGSSSVSYAVSGVAVDPYISGAVFCEDKDGDGSCEDGEQLSTTSDASGNFYFSNALVGTGQILMKDGSFGKHNGTDYDLQLAIPITSSATNSINVTPMTTLMARGEFSTSNDLANSLNTSANGAFAGGVVAAPQLANIDIVANPLANLTLTSSTVTDDELKTFRAQLASYTSLKVLEQLKVKYPALSSNDYQHALGVVYGSALKLINAGLSSQLLSDAETYKQTLTTGVLVTVPAITLDDITKTAITISQRLAIVGADACAGSTTNHMEAAEGNVTAKMSLITGSNGWGMKLGQRYYAVRNKALFLGWKSAYPSLSFGPDIDAGLEECPSGVFDINTTDGIQCHPQD